MILNKIQKNILIGVVAALIFYIGYLQLDNYKLSVKNKELKEEKKKELKEVRDSSFINVNKIIKNSISLKKHDSLMNINIKYIPYEKPTYPNRNLDGALDVLSDYTYERTKKKDSIINHSRKIN